MKKRIDKIEIIDKDRVIYTLSKEMDLINLKNEKEGYRFHFYKRNWEIKARRYIKIDGIKASTFNNKKKVVLNWEDEKIYERQKDIKIPSKIYKKANIHAFKIFKNNYL